MNKKSRASLAGSIIIFMIAFLVFCICAVDVGRTVTSRYKAQKITETVALYMASYVNSLPEERRTTESLNTIKERFENLYSDYDLNGNYQFQITEIDLRANASSSKIKVTSETSTPTLFLRYTGMGIINIIQTAYASSSSFDLSRIDTDDYSPNSYTYEANQIITDKNGADIKIRYNKPYFAFAGLKKGNTPGNDNIHWVEIGSMSDDDNKTSYTISNPDETYDVNCISKEDAKYDFSADENKTVGLARYIKIIKTDACTATDTEEDDTPEYAPIVTALNSAKIISRQTFLND